LMVESEAAELPEDVMLGAVMFGHEAARPVIDAIIELAELAAKDPWDLPEPADNSALIARIKEMAEADLRAAYKETVKQTRTAKVAEVRERVMQALVEGEGLDGNLIGGLF